MIHKHQTTDTFVYTKQDIEKWAREDVNRRLGNNAVREKREVTIEWARVKSPIQGQSQGQTQDLEIPFDVLTITAESKHADGNGGGDDHISENGVK